MPSEQSKQTLTDYVAIVISPALIIGLITSLIFFLLEVIYSGAFLGRLRWISFFFIFGMVFVARMRMHPEAASRAGLYGFILGFLAWVAMQGFVAYPEHIRALSWLINLGLVWLISWCAYRLTWDCTNVDEETDINAEGVLQAAGIDTDEGKPVTPTARSDEATDVEPLTSPTDAKVPPNWWERYQRYSEKQQKKGRALGVWVVYFSLAALPLFGLGQALIPLEDQGRRQFAFWMMGGYVACGLGLLLTTCFLGLRRYLRQRDLKMPAAMTGVWLTMGGTLIVLLLVLGAFLPRPHAEYSVLNVLKTGSRERDASNYAVKGDSPGKDAGKAGEERQDKEANKDSGGKDGKDARGQGKDGKGSGKNGKGKDSGSQKDKDGDKASQGKDRSDGKDSAKDGQKDKGSGSAEKQDKGGGRGKQTPSSSSPSTPPPTTVLTSFLAKLSPILKWIVFALFVIVVLVMIVRSGLQFLANFTQWAKDLLDALRNFWANLFGARKDRARVEQDEEDAAGPLARPFAAFANPFTTGEAAGMSSQELLRYTFAALQAWARERGLGRQQGETPLEFANRLAEEHPPLAADVRRLAFLYARAVYARGDLPRNTFDEVKQFWQTLVAVTEQPLSASVE